MRPPSLPSVVPSVSPSVSFWATMPGSGVFTAWATPVAVSDRPAANTAPAAIRATRRRVL
ncbi:hypothetical protein GCM10010406_00180 [Streptomyces thermolineatus]|uniref:Uncharacterized protein n=1 Tax=Streptomyces thermolineatus TaxID=44033 RepID=A0ABP5XWN9_9ACTN